LDFYYRLSLMLESWSHSEKLCLRRSVKIWWSELHSLESSWMIYH